MTTRNLTAAERLKRAEDNLRRTLLELVDDESARRVINAAVAVLVGEREAAVERLCAEEARAEREQVADMVARGAGW